MSSGTLYGRATCADGWRAVLEPVVARYRGTVKRLYFRGDAAFANPEIYEFLEAEVTVLARQLPDKAIAPILNRADKTPGSGNGRTRSRVCFLRNHRGIPPYREGER